MALVDIQNYLKLLSVMREKSENNIWLYYDTEADTLYVNFKKPSYATDSELTDEDVIVRYADQDIIGFTILHASQR